MLTFIKRAASSLAAAAAARNLATSSRAEDIRRFVDDCFGVDTANVLGENASEWFRAAKNAKHADNWNFMLSRMNKYKVGKGRLCLGFVTSKIQFRN
jgi:hypothetical protein